MEVEPGQEGQVDVGTGAWIEEDGRKRRPHILRVVESHINEHSGLRKRLAIVPGSPVRAVDIPARSGRQPQNGHKV